MGLNRRPAAVRSSSNGFNFLLSCGLNSTGRVNSCTDITLKPDNMPHSFGVGHPLKPRSNTSTINATCRFEMTFCLYCNVMNAISNPILLERHRELQVRNCAFLTSCTFTRHNAEVYIRRPCFVQMFRARKGRCLSDKAATESMMIFSSVLRQTTNLRQKWHGWRHLAFGECVAPSWNAATLLCQSPPLISISMHTHTHTHTHGTPHRKVENRRDENGWTN